MGPRAETEEREKDEDDHQRSPRPLSAFDPHREEKQMIIISQYWTSRRERKILR